MRIAVAGGKGGCGKTTTALGVAAALVDARREPVVLDCDRDMPNLHVYAGTRDEPGLDDLAGGTSLDRASHDATRPRGVQVVPGQPGSDVQAALESLMRTDGETRSADSGPPLVLDTPAGASEDVAVPLRFADRCVLVTTASRPCVRATLKTATMARALDAPIAGVVVSRSARIPSGLPEAVGVPRNRIVAVPSTDDPLSERNQRPVRRFVGFFGPNA